MKLVLKGLLSIALLASGLTVLGNCDDKGCPEKSTCTDCKDEKGSVFGRTFFAYRPVSSNTARKMMGVEDKLHLFGKDEFYGEVNVALEYTQTFKNNRLGKYFSFVKDNNSMTYGPGAFHSVECDQADIFGYNFGTSCSGTICFSPKITNFIADIDLFLGWDEFICGLWTRLDIPINHTRWDLKLGDANKESSASQDFTPCLFDNGGTDVTPVPYCSLRDAFVGDKAWGLVPKLNAGRINGKKHETTVAAIAFDLGYDFIRKERGHLAASIHAVAPTGTRPHAGYLFDAVSGANHSWQLGGTLNAGYRLWENCDGDHSLYLGLDAEITHLFYAKQHRLLGLKNNGAGSSWLLLSKWDAEGDFVGFERAANILDTEVKVGAGVMADVSLMLQYNACNFFGALGYNFWIRSKEKAKHPKVEFAEDTYAIYAPITEDCEFISSFSKATIAGTDLGTTTCATADETFIFVKRSDVDVCTALTPQSYSHKVFGNLGYNWKDCDWMPFITVFGEVEFGHENKAVHQWGVGLKGGVAF